LFSIFSEQKHPMLRALIALGGPVFGKELVELARRRRYFATRLLYGLALLLAIFIAWQGSSFTVIYGGRQPTIADVARLAQALFLAVAVVQYGAVYLFVPIMLSGTICSEREEHTLELLFTTHLRDREIVLGKVGSRLAVVFLLFLSGLPVLAIIRLFGGIDGGMLVRVEAATLLAMFVAASLATYFSVVSPTPMVALVRTYWWLALWLLLVPLVLQLVIAALSFGNGSMPLWMRLNAIMLWFNPLGLFGASFEPLILQQLGVRGWWLFTGYWSMYLMPSLVALFFSWRAVRRLRSAPRPLFSLRRLVKNPAFDRDPLEALVRGAQPPALPAAALAARSPFADEDLPVLEEFVTDDASSIEGRPTSDAGMTAAGGSPFAGESHPAPVMEPTPAVSQWLRWRYLAVRNPLWRRARLARVYDRDRYLFRIQIAGAVMLAGLFFLFFLFALRSNFMGDVESGTVLGFLIPTWIVVWFLTAIVAGSSLVGDRRRGFLDQVLVTPLEARDIVLGTWLAVFEHLKLAYALPAVIVLVYVLAFGLPIVPAVLSWVLGAAFGAVLVALGTTCSLVARQTGQAIVPALALPLVLAIGWPMLVMSDMPWNENDESTWYLLSCAAMVVTAVASWALTRRSPTPMRASLLSICIYQLLLLALSPLVLTIHDPIGGFYLDWTDELAFAGNCVGVMAYTVAEYFDHSYRNSYREHDAYSNVLALVWSGPFVAAAAGYLGWSYFWLTRNFDRLTGRTLINPDSANSATANTVTVA
jgi:ABC-type transport system involved in multi-copper enzyme maturation permease subunit